MAVDRQFVARHGLHGLAGTACIAIGALGIGWLPLETELLDFPLVGALRDGLTGSLAARALVFLGLAILLQSWLVLGADLRERIGSPRDLGWVLAIWAAPLIASPPLFSRDAYSYYVQGRLMIAGLDPTTAVASQQPGWFQDGADPMWAESPTPYGPLFLAFEHAIAAFAHPNAYLAGVLFRLLALAGVALLAWSVPRLAQLHGVDPARAMWLAVLNPLVIMHFVIGAHNDALLVGLIAWAFWLAGTCRCIWGAVAVGLAASVKPIALVALPFIGLAWAGARAPWLARIRAWLFAAFVAGVTMACVYLAVDAGWGLLSAAFNTPSGVLTWLSPSTAIGQLSGLTLTWLGLAPDPSMAVTIVRTVGELIALAFIGWLIVWPGQRPPTRGAGLALLAIVVLGPVVQPWYLLWGLPLLAASGLGRRSFQVAVLLTAAFTVHGMVESSTTADNFLDITDGITFLLALGIVSLIAFASPRERNLLLGRTAARLPRVETGAHVDRHLDS